MEGHQERLEPLDRADDLSSLSGEVEAVGRDSGSFEEWCVLRPVGVPEIPVETAVLARRVHPRGTDEIRVRDALGPLFADEDFTAGEFADMYPRLGQPGLSPALLLMVTILQFRHNLSDREAAQAVADRISWKYALLRHEVA